MNISSGSAWQLHIPNLLSAFRLTASPVLLYFAWSGKPTHFLVLLALSFLSDCLDGYLARRLNSSSELGARLDSWGDFAIYMTAPLSAWWLWPEIISREAYYVLIAIVSYVLPLIIGFIKFGRLPSYHTWSAKGAAILMSLAIFLLFLFDIVWLFHFAVIFHALGACEEIAMTFILTEWRCNIPSLWHVLAMVKEEKKSGEHKKK